MWICFELRDSEGCLYHNVMLFVCMFESNDCIHAEINQNTLVNLDLFTVVMKQIPTLNKHIQQIQPFGRKLSM